MKKSATAVFCQEHPSRETRGKYSETPPSPGAADSGVMDRCSSLPTPNTQKHLERWVSWAEIKSSLLKEIPLPLWRSFSLARDHGKKRISALTYKCHLLFWGAFTSPNFYWVCHLIFSCESEPSLLPSLCSLHSFEQAVLSNHISKYNCYCLSMPNFCYW